MLNAEYSGAGDAKPYETRAPAPHGTQGSEGNRDK